MTTATPPAVSVVLSTYNRRRSLEHAIAALLRQAAAPPYEILVVDNRSTDGTADLVSRLVRDSAGGRLSYLYEPRQGLSHARNAGIAGARAPVIAFTDDDVVVREDWVASIARAMDAYPQAEYAGGRVLPRWTSPPPRWLTRAHWSPLALQDLSLIHI